MDKLLQPDPGLIIWTIVTFMVVVFVLSKTVWKPILSAIEGREKGIRGDIDRAAKANADAEALRLKYEAQIVEAQQKIQEMVNQARADGERTRADIVAAAKTESERIVEKGRKDLVGETDRLRGQLRAEVADLSVSVAEKILRRTVDKKMAEELIVESVKSLGETRS
jgi:F-type H+-transporting ATPase subunit b